MVGFLARSDKNAADGNARDHGVGDGASQHAAGHDPEAATSRLGGDNAQDAGARDELFFGGWRCGRLHPRVAQTDDGEWREVLACGILDEELGGIAGHELRRAGIERHATATPLGDDGGHIVPRRGR